MSQCKVHPVAPCDCPLAGYCDRHQRIKGTALHALCQTREDYRRKWDQEVRTPKPKPEPKPRNQSKPLLIVLECIHRGEQVGLVENCGCAHGEVPIHICTHPEISREVVLRQVGKRPHTLPYQSYPVCRGCELQTRPDGKPSLLQGIETSTRGDS